MRTFANAHDQRCAEPGCGHKVWIKAHCQLHYYRDYAKRRANAVSDSHPGVVRVSVRGWGFLG